MRLRPRHHHALKTAAARLADDFHDIFGTETIERFLHSSYDQFANRATIIKFLPLMAERFARQRLTALAKVEGLHHDGKPTVLFLCTHNAGRSQLPAPPWFAWLSRRLGLSDRRSGHRSAPLQAPPATSPAPIGAFGEVDSAPA